MAGLLQQAQGAPQQAQAPMQGQPQGQPQGQAQGDPRVDMDPEQGQQQTDELVSAMLESLYGPMLEDVKEMLEQQPDAPHEAIGRVVSQLMLTSWQALADQGSTVPPGVMVQAAMVASQAVGEMAIKMGLISEEESAEPVEAGFMIAMGQFGQAAGKDMPPEQKQRYKQIIQGIAQAKEASQGQQPQEQPPQEQAQPRAAPGPAMQGGV